ncbi:MAG: glutamyl-tRNA reductase [Halobacteriales archaeon]
MSVITGISVAHQRASVDEIEAAGATGEAIRVERLGNEPAVEEAFALQTCNRSEAYVVTKRPEAGREVLDEVVPSLPAGSVRELGHEESLRHLMRVAGGLESLVLGEDQILGQLRDAYERARGADALGPILEEGLTKAIHVGERAREETAINEGTLSLANAAVRLADDEHGLDGSTALVVGAGDMGTTAAKALAAGPVEAAVVANRTVAHAEHVAGEIEAPARAVGLDGLSAVVPEADVVVAATGSQDPVVDRAALADAGETYVVDIARPRDVAPDAIELPDVTYRDLDSLEDITERTRRQRRAAARKVEAMIDEEFDRLLEQYKRRRADDVIAAMYEGAEHVKRREVEKAVRKLQQRGEFTGEQRAVVESLADAMVGQLLAAPTKSLREAAAEDDWTTINTAIRLLDPEFGPDGALAVGVDASEAAENATEDG